MRRRWAKLRSAKGQTSGLSCIVAVAAGNYHSITLKADGTIRTFGKNAKGEIGDGTTTDRSTAVYLSTIHAMTGIAAGGDHSLSVCSDGTLLAWGNGQLGDGTTTPKYTPTQVTGVSGIVAIAAGGSHVRELRKERGLTQEQAAELCGLQYNLFQHYELGVKKNPGLLTLEKI